MKKNIAFVASTLPFRQIVDYCEALDIAEVVCATTALQISYQKGFSRLGIGILPKSAAGNRVVTNLKLIYHLFASKNAVIFHECAWRNLDIFILAFGIKTIFLPTVTTSGRRKVNAKCIPTNRTITLLTSKWFNYYETPLDGGGDGVYYVAAVKEEYRKVNAAPSFSASRKYSDKSKIKPNRTRILILCSSDVVPSEVLRCVYRELISRLQSVGIVADIKDHPNPKSRLGEIDDLGGQIVDSDLPLECLNFDEYIAFVAIASSGLASGKKDAVEVFTVAKLLPQEFHECLSERLSHLHALNIHPVSPESMNDLVDGLISLRQRWVI